jgi:hypothetical protein
MSNQVTLALIVAQPGPLRDSLQALMTTTQDRDRGRGQRALGLAADGRPDSAGHGALDARLPESGVWAELKQGVPADEMFDVAVRPP